MVPTIAFVGKTVKKTVQKMLETSLQIIWHTECVNQKTEGDRDKWYGMVKDFIEEVKLEPKLQKS